MVSGIGHAGQSDKADHCFVLYGYMMAYIRIILILSC